MAAVYGDSFDTYASGDKAQRGWTSTSGTISIAAALNDNGLSVPIGITAQNLLMNVTTSGATAIIGFAFKASAFIHAADDLLCGFRNSTTDLTYLVLKTTTGQLEVRRGTSTVLGTSVYTLPANSWVYIEFKVVLASGATGSYEVRVNGANILSGSSVQTSPSSTTWNNFIFGTTSSAGGAGATWLIDDLYVLDGSGSVNNDFLGPIKYNVLRPSGAGTTTQMAASAGSNYQCVDETASNGDTDYVAETTAGELDTYAMSDTTVTGTVKFVQTTLVVRSDGAGSETVAPVFRLSGTDYAGTAQSVGLSYLHKLQIYDQSPDTSAAWTTSELDGAEFGPKMVS